MINHKFNTKLEDAGILYAERKSDKKQFVVISGNGAGFITGSESGKLEELCMNDVRIFRKKDGVEV